MGYRKIYIMNKGMENSLSHKLGLIRKMVLGINSPVKSTIIVDSKVCAVVITRK
jgi:hypothetical protein